MCRVKIQIKINTILYTPVHGCISIMPVYVCIYACLLVCIVYVCMPACMYAFMSVCLHVCMPACLYSCMHVCMYDYLYFCTSVYLYIGIYVQHQCSICDICLYIYGCLYICGIEITETILFFVDNFFDYIMHFYFFLNFCLYCLRARQFMKCEYQQRLTKQTSYVL